MQFYGFPATGFYNPYYTTQTGTEQQLNNPMHEMNYIECILKLNIGKLACLYMNFENSQWGSKVFKGIIEGAGKDHIILSDQASKMRYILLTKYLDYVTFDDEINYFHPHGTQNTTRGNK